MAGELKLAIPGEHRRPAPLFDRISYDARMKQPDIFRPSKIPIGPYFHGYANYKELQAKKDQCFQRICREYSKQLSDFENALAEKTDDLMNKYNNLPKWVQELDDQRKFSEMMIVDACYLLEIMREACGEVARDYCDIDLFNVEDEDVYRRDLLLYENQIPLSVLESVASVQDPKRQPKEIYEYLIDLILGFFSLRRFFSQKKSLRSRHKCLHILDVYRHGILGRSEAPRGEPLQLNMPSATKLKEARIGIRPNTIQSLMNISFSKKTLMLPQIHLNEATKSIYANLVWFERHGGSGSKQFSSYVWFMSTLLKNSADCNHIVERGIINTSLQDNEVIEMFHNLRQESKLNPEQEMDYTLLMTARKVRERYNKNSEEWRKDLHQNYLKSPWAFIALVGAILLFIQSTIQTIYTVLGYYNS